MQLGFKTSVTGRSRGRRALLGLAALTAALLPASLVQADPSYTGSPTCDAGVSYMGSCNSSIQMTNGSDTDPAGGTLTYVWGTDCPGASFSPNNTAETPTLMTDDPANCMVMLTVTDTSNDMMSMCEANVTVNSNLSIGCPAPSPASSDPGQCGADVSFNVTALDGCGNSVPVSCSHESGSYFPVGSTTVTCNASTDTESAVCDFTVIVFDGEAPEVACNNGDGDGDAQPAGGDGDGDGDGDGGIRVCLGPDMTVCVYADDVAFADDNCEVTSLTIHCDDDDDDDDSRVCFDMDDLGHNEVEVCAEDAAGNSTCTTCNVEVFPQPQDRASGTEKGSLLIFSKVEIRWDQAGNLVQDTFLDISNDKAEAVDVKFYFINGDAALEADGLERAHPGWNNVDGKMRLTANQPAYFSALTGMPGPRMSTGPLAPFGILDPGSPPGRPATDGTNDRVLRGIIYAWAVDNEEKEIKWDHLKGEALLVNYRDGTSWEYNAWAFQVVEKIYDGDRTSSANRRLELDGREYAKGPAQLLFDFYASGSSAFSGTGGAFAGEVVVETDLTLHPVSVDLRQETDGPVTTKANITVWNENEAQFTGLHRCISCWDQTLLSLYTDQGIANHFLRSNLQTDKGKARIDGIESMVCDVDFDPDNNDDFPFPPRGGDDRDDRDILSEDAAILGVAAKFLTFGNGVKFDQSGLNLIATGRESASIKYDDVDGSPPSAEQPADEQPQIMRWLDEQVNRASRQRGR